MRDIKFRSLDVLTGCWVYGNLLTTPAGTHIIPQSLGVNFIQSYQVDKDTVGQYTGLKDKNGVEIYDGDITLDKWDNKDVIKWHKEYGLYYTCPIESFNKTEAEIEKAYSFLDLLFKNNVPKTFLTVIGNIHEDPELLEVSS